MHADEGTIHAWLDGELPPAEAAALEAHVASCTTCAAAVAEARGLVAASSRILGALDDVPAGVTPAIVKAAVVGTARARQRMWRYPQFAAAAAAVVLLVGSAVVYRQSAVGAPAAADAVAVQEAAPPSVASAPMPAPRVSNAMPSDEVAKRQDAAPALPMQAAEATGPNDARGREAKAVARAITDEARPPEADSTSRRQVLADAVVTSERERLVGEQRVQLAEARTPAAAPPPAAAKQAAGARNEVGGAAAGRASFSRDEAAVPGLAAPRCFDLQRSAAAVTAGVPPFVQLTEMPGPTVGGKAMRAVVSSAGAGWFWYHLMDGGLFLTRVVDGAVAYEARFSGLGATDVVGTERACVSR